MARMDLRMKKNTVSPIFIFDYYSSESYASFLNTKERDVITCLGFLSLDTLAGHDSNKGFEDFDFFSESGISGVM